MFEGPDGVSVHQLYATWSAIHVETPARRRYTRRFQDLERETNEKEKGLQQEADHLEGQVLGSLEQIGPARISHYSSR